MKLSLAPFTPPARIVVLTTLSILTMWLGQGCGSVNQGSRLTIGGESVPALTSGGDRIAPAGASLVGGTRDHWEAQTIVVPVDGTEHHPHYTLAQPNYSESARAMGVYPTAESALDLASPARPRVWEAVAAPFHGAADIVMLIPRAIQTSPRCVATSPSEPFQRYREGEGDEAPVLVPEPATIGATAK